LPHFYERKYSALIACLLSALLRRGGLSHRAVFRRGQRARSGVIVCAVSAHIVTCLAQTFLQAVTLLVLLSVLFALAAFSATRRDRVQLYSALSGLLSPQAESFLRRLCLRLRLACFGWCLFFLLRQRRVVA
jgi:hypothetical protein